MRTVVAVKAGVDPRIGSGGGRNMLDEGPDVLEGRPPEMDVSSAAAGSFLLTLGRGFGLPLAAVEADVDADIELT